MDSLIPLLKQVKDFEGVPEEQLQWLIDHAECIEFKEGDYLFKPGKPFDNMYIVLEGGFVVRVTQNKQHRIAGKIEKFDISGLLPYSRAQETKIASAEATQDSRVLALHRSKMTDLIRECHELTTKLVHRMSTRIRELTKSTQQNDKIMALGKLSAGLAHELNNPSAAVIRGAQELKKHLGYMPDKFKDVMNIRMNEEQVDAANEIIFAKIQGEKENLSMLERSEQVDDLMDWLDDHEIEDSDEVAENFVDFGVTIDDLEGISEQVPEESLPPVINWMSQVLTTEKLVGDLEEASKRINDLVSSIKSYTHMDQAREKAPTDIHTGIDNTLTMLNHKVKKGPIEVVRTFGEDLPEPEILASEMNQVWTNLIDNAIDAMDESSEKQLTIETFKDKDFVNVKISDTGSGIPDDVREKIFDPFFTTKAIGKGTGLGLEVVQQIVTVQHNGAIYVDSEPGHTTFRVCIPIKSA